MSDVTAQFRRVQSAYAQPTLLLIARRSSPAVIAVFRSMFSTEKPNVPTARMHDQANGLLADLRRAGLPDVPDLNGRDACKKWMNDGWLNRTTDANGDEVYSLTANALDGLRTVDRLTKDRAVSLSSHLIAGLIRHLRDFSASISPDVGEYVTTLTVEKARIEAEIDRVLSGGALEEASDDEIIQGFTELQRFLAELPSDFSRVSESYRDFEMNLISEFRAESLATGEAVRRYLAHVQTLATSSAAGRGFEGALELLRDPELLDQVNQYIYTLLSDERAAALLTVEERSQVQNAVLLIREGLKQVLERRARVSRTLNDYITSHDVERDHELAETLRSLESAAREWMQTAGPRAKAPIELLPGKLDVQHLRTKLYDPANDEPPLPVTQVEKPDRVGNVSLAELRARGGPSHAALREELEAHLGVPVESLAGLFHSLPENLRRPVEVVGLLPLARRSGLKPTGEVEVYETLRPDGTRRLLDVPRYASAPTTDGDPADAGNENR